MDAYRNFAYSTVVTAPSPASSGTSLVVAASAGAAFPAVPFNATVWPAGAQPTNANAEIVRVTNIVGDTFTMTRTQESTSARAIIVGDQIAATYTAKLVTDVTADIAAVTAPAMVELADVTLGGDGAIDFTSISGSYAHLRLVVYGRTDEAVALSVIGLRFNNDSAANYDSQQASGTGATANAAELFGQTSAKIGNGPGNSAGANLFGSFTIDIPYYAGSSNNKVFTSTFAHKSGTSTGNLYAGVVAGFWRSNSAITRITLVPGAGTNFKTGSRATLYGLT